jgi:hypothetical protein
MFDMDFSDPHTLALLGATAALGQASMPSRLPIPTGAILAQAAGAMGPAAQAGYHSQLEQAQTRLTNSQAAMSAASIDAVKRQLQLMGSMPGSEMPATPTQNAPANMLAPAGVSNNETSGAGLTTGSPLAAGSGGVDPSQVYGYLTNDLKATPNEAALLTSAAGSESGFDPTKTHDGGIGYGMFGHNGDRLTAMQQMAGTNTPGWQDQLKFSLDELRNRPEGAQVNDAKTPEQLTDLQMKFEQPNRKINNGNYDQRLDLTRQILTSPPSQNPQYAQGPATTLNDGSPAGGAAGAPQAPSGPGGLPPHVGLSGNGPGAQLINQDTGVPIAPPDPQAAIGGTALSGVLGQGAPVTHAQLSGGAPMPPPAAAAPAGLMAPGNVVMPPNTPKYNMPTNPSLAGRPLSDPAVQAAFANALNPNRQPTPAERADQPILGGQTTPIPTAPAGSAGLSGNPTSLRDALTRVLSGAPSAGAGAGAGAAPAPALSPALAPAAATAPPVPTIANPAAVAAMPQPMPGNRISPAQVQWAKQYSALGEITKIQAPKWVQDMAEMGPGMPLSPEYKAGIAAAEAWAKNPAEIAAAYAKQGMQLDANGRLVPIPGYTTVTEANSRAKATGEAGPKFNEMRPGNIGLTGDQIAAQGGAVAAPVRVTQVDPQSGRETAGFITPPLPGQVPGPAPQTGVTPSPDGTPGINAPVAPGINAAPQMPIIKLGPGEEHSLVSRADAEQKHRQAVIDQANTAQVSQVGLQNMQNDVAGGFKQGPFASHYQTVGTYMRLIDPSWNGQVANYEDFVKNAGALTRTAVHDTSPRAAAQEYTMINATLPNPELSPNGLQMVTSELMGLNDYKIVKAQAQAAWEQKNGGIGNVSGFETDFQKNLSPYAFVLARMDPTDLRQMALHLQATPQGQRQLSTMRRQLQYIKANGLDQGMQ